MAVRDSKDKAGPTLAFDPRLAHLSTPSRATDATRRTECGSDLAPALVSHDGGSSAMTGDVHERGSLACQGRGLISTAGLREGQGATRSS
ncbi:DUF397 domain-containing protein [Micromonospora sp. WMMD734]|uniref:DUF397 domain-containing protein n=1 Tax=Micromonospora sp. WMMD734 TaxID=3404129 RepID=UPI003B9627E3